jgi:ribosomal protein L12E/L44/L45/RPP1/RPP2
MAVVVPTSGGQPGLHSKTLPQKEKEEEEEEEEEEDSDNDKQ